MKGSRFYSEIDRKVSSYCDWVVGQSRSVYHYRFSAINLFHQLYLMKLYITVKALFAVMIKLFLFICTLKLSYTSY